MLACLCCPSFLRSGGPVQVRGEKSPPSPGDPSTGCLPSAVQPAHTCPHLPALVLISSHLPTPVHTVHTCLHLPAHAYNSSHSCLALASPAPTGLSRFLFWKQLCPQILGVRTTKTKTPHLRTHNVKDQVCPRAHALYTGTDRIDEGRGPDLYMGTERDRGTRPEHGDRWKQKGQRG